MPCSPRAFLVFSIAGRSSDPLEPFVIVFRQKKTMWVSKFVMIGGGVAALTAVVVFTTTTSHPTLLLLVLGEAAAAAGSS